MLELRRRRQHDVGPARGVGEHLLVHHGEQVLTRQPGEDALAVRERENGVPVVDVESGDGRLEEGFRLFREGRAKAMLISGVGENVRLGDLIAGPFDTPSGFSAERLGRIYLGREADSTQTNALETQAWMQAQGFSSLALVTANYHMRRSLLEFSARMPGYAITPVPVAPEDFKRAAWWRDAASRRLLLSEYHKYLATWLRLHQPDG